MTFQDVYFDPGQPGSYGGVRGLQKALTKRVNSDENSNTKSNKRSEKKKPPTISELARWLQTENAYTLHKQVKRKFRRRKVVVGGICQQFEMDLVDIRSLKNRPYNYLLTCVDVFSKFAWVVPVRRKTGDEILGAFKKILKTSTFGVPLYIHTDHGREFYNSTFQNFLKTKGIELFSTNNFETKATVVERFNRTLLNRLHRYLTKSGETKFINVLPLLVESYNNSYHSTIKMAPSEVNGSNSGELWGALYGGKWSEDKSKLKIGDEVRLSKFLKKFKKGYTPNWTEEVFSITKVLLTDPVTYKVTDGHGETLEGTFYPDEVQKVIPEVYNIEKVLKTRKRGGRKELFVRWKGYPSSFDEWISDEQLVK